MGVAHSMVVAVMYMRTGEHESAWYCATEGVQGMRMDLEEARLLYPVVYFREGGAAMIVGSAPEDGWLVEKAKAFGIDGWPGQRVFPPMTAKAPKVEFDAFCKDLLLCIEENRRGGALGDDEVRSFSGASDGRRRSSSAMRSDPQRDGVVVQFYVQADGVWYELGNGDATSRPIGTADQAAEHNKRRRPVEYTNGAYVRLRALRENPAFAGLVESYGDRKWPGQGEFGAFPGATNTKAAMEFYFSMLLDCMQHVAENPSSAETPRRLEEVAPAPPRRVWGGYADEDWQRREEEGWAAGDDLVSTAASSRPRVMPVPSYRGGAPSETMTRDQLLAALRVLERMVERMDGGV